MLVESTFTKHETPSLDLGWQLNEPFGERKTMTPTIIATMKSTTLAVATTDVTTKTVAPTTALGTTIKATTTAVATTSASNSKNGSSS